MRPVARIMACRATDPVSMQDDRMVDAGTLHLPVAHAEAVLHGGFPAQDHLVQGWVSGRAVGRSFEGLDDLATRYPRIRPRSTMPLSVTMP